MRKKSLILAGKIKNEKKMRGMKMKTITCFGDRTRRGTFFIAELLRAEGAQSRAPFLRNFGNPTSRESLVMTSAYERANGGGASCGNPNGGAEECHPFLARNSFQFVVNKRYSGR